MLQDYIDLMQGGGLNNLKQALGLIVVQHAAMMGMNELCNNLMQTYIHHFHPC